MMAGAAPQPGKTLADLLVGEPAREPAGRPAARNIPISGIAIDSRQVRPGDLFLACRGLRHNGMEYIPAALKAGAVAVAVDAAEPPAVEPSAPIVRVADLRQRAGCIISRFFDEPSRAMRLFGVTGTNGKSTVAYLIARALSSAGRRTGLIGTLGHGRPTALKPAARTTPDALQIHALLAGWRGRFDDVALEVSSHALDQGRVAGLVFDIAVFTNLSRDHLDYHADMDAYAAAKFRLFEAPGLKQAVVNVADPYGLKLRARLAGGLAVVRYSAHAETAAGAEVVCREAKPHGLGYRLRLHSPWGEARIDTRLPGRFNIDNNLAAFAALGAAGMPAPEAARALSAVSGIPGRMECFSAADRPLLVVDYAHTPDALQKALLALRPHCRGRLHCVFGCGGERDSGKRPQMGAIAAALADRVILTSDNPRSEPPAGIIRQILQGIRDRRQVTIEEDRAAAITGAFANADQEDVILIAGKGHEMTQTAGGRSLPFSDRELAGRLTAVAA